MACILKVPDSESKGVVTFTTQERDNFIFVDDNLRIKIEKLKQNWIIGLHHNWHDYSFKYDNLFDFSMAGDDDLIEVNNQKFNLINLDACNFSPKCFHPSDNEKFWDILYVARAVYFKKIPEFFKVIRELYDQGKMYRVLLISPIPDECKINPNSKTSYCNIRDDYNRLFNKEEQDLFTLMTTDYRSPFPFDIETLSHFYKSSKIFVHTADDERRCRVAGYAWASGMPVVCMNSVASLLDKEIRKEPYVFQAGNYDDFPEMINRSLEYVNSEKFELSQMQLSIDCTSEGANAEKLKQQLLHLFGVKGKEESYNLNCLDFRLGSHFGFGDTTNTYSMTLVQFVDLLLSEFNGKILDVISSKNPELFINKQFVHYQKHFLSTYFYFFKKMKMRVIKKINKFKAYFIHSTNRE